MLQVMIIVWAICLWLLIGGIAALMLRPFIKATRLIWVGIITLWPLVVVACIVLDFISGVRAATKKGKRV